MNGGFRRILVEQVDKKFQLDTKHQAGALAWLLRLFFRRGAKRALPVLEGISFEAKEGEIIGIVGRNGSGKSTLLKIIAKILVPDSGVVQTHGQVLYLGGFGQGLIPKLSVRENIDLIGSLMGLTRKDIKLRFDEIVAFSGLGQFLDAKVFQLSSGMAMRLAFSTSIHCIKHKNPDILLIDEVLGTIGDIEFHEKASAKIDELIRARATVVLVSHNAEILKKYCHRVLWLEHQRIAGEGSPEEVLRHYEQSVQEHRSS